MADRRTFLKTGALTGAGMLLPLKTLAQQAYTRISRGALQALDIAKYTMQLVIPPAMPKTKTISSRGQTIDYYEIAVRQFTQQILPPSMPPTTVWSYVSVQNPATQNYPAFTIESRWKRPVRVKWINQLVDSNNNYLPHLLPVDQTLHWANPPGPRDSHGMSQAAYTGPVPMVVHVHGAHATQDSDGYAEAWYLPNAKNIPAGFSKVGSSYNTFKSLSLNGNQWTPGSAVFQYGNDQRAATIWYHDHSLGMTRLNVYAGPAGFFLLRGGPDDQVTGTLPGPAPGVGANPFGTFYEIPIAIQDRSFNSNGSLFYPSSRTFFEPPFGGPYAPDTDVPPIWNPEFFGNTMVVNGRSWPFLNVERRLYRFRILNGCNARFLILKLTTNPRAGNNSFNTPEGTFWQIGTEGGFLPPTPGAIPLPQLLMSPAERADVIIDFSQFGIGDEVYLVNDGPDAPFAGISEADLADFASTGQVMQFRVIAGPANDPATHPEDLILPTLTPLSGGNPRRMSLNEAVSAVVDVNGDPLLPGGEPAGPIAALLGTYNIGTGVPDSKGWGDAISENPALGATEVWEFYNFTADAHPIHIHEVQFNVVNRQALDHLDDDGIAVSPAFPASDTTRPPEPWETGFKDTVIAYPGEVTRVRAKFDLPGQYVWHCHIVEHEDNEMMRPFRVGP